MSWIARDRPRAAERLTAAVKSLTRLLAEQPRAGTERPELAGPPFRFMPVQGFDYLLVYDASRTPPLIVRVVHGALDLPHVLADLRREHPGAG